MKSAMKTWFPARRGACIEGRRARRWRLRLTDVLTAAVAAFALLVAFSMPSEPLTSFGLATGNPVIEIELEIFSGRPNPAWQLDDAEAGQLLALLDDLPEAASPQRADLGYRGFVVKRSNDDGSTAPPVHVVAGTVALGARHLADTKSAEAWLIRSARQHGWSALVDSIPLR